MKIDRLPGWANEEPVRIFLASSEELREDRDEFEIYVSRMNQQYAGRGISLKVVRWEDFFDAMSKTRMHDEYKRAIRACDVFVSLFGTKAGPFTVEEFEVAYDHFKATDRPLDYTYFKEVAVNVDELTPEDFQSLQAFKGLRRG